MKAKLVTTRVSKFMVVRYSQISQIESNFAKMYQYFH